MNEQILSELKDVHVPPEPSLWPLAWGYYAVFIILIIVLGGSIWFVRRSIKKRIFRKKWQLELKGIENTFFETNDVARLQTELSWLTRRLAFECERAKNPHARILELEFSLLRLSKKKHVTKNNRLFLLLNEDRFKATNNVDGRALLTVYKELSKSWRL